MQRIGHSAREAWEEEVQRGNSNVSCLGSSRVTNLDRWPQDSLKHPGDFPLVPVDCEGAASNWCMWALMLFIEEKNVCKDTEQSLEIRQIKGFNPKCRILTRGCSDGLSGHRVLQVYFIMCFSFCILIRDLHLNLFSCDYTAIKRKKAPENS